MRWLTRLALAGTLALVSCRERSGAEVRDAGAPTLVTAADAMPLAPLAPPCVEFLAQLQCWLRASGNDGAEADLAVAIARGSFETRAEAAASCERGMLFGAELIGSAGCAHVEADVSKLPPSTVSTCPAGEFFFVRHDGHVSGCHRDCARQADCPSGSSCTSVGSAAGGPIEEPFCE